MAMKYFPLFCSGHLRFETAPRRRHVCRVLKGNPLIQPTKPARKPFRRQDSKLRLRCDDSELDAAHVGIIILVDVAVVIALIAPKGGRELQQQKLRIRLFYISLGRQLIYDLPKRLRLGYGVYADEVDEVGKISIS